jgi:hypothetical protein
LLLGRQGFCQIRAQTVLRAKCRTPKAVIPVLFALAFTIAPHLQTINYRGCFSRFAGI